MSFQAITRLLTQNSLKTLPNGRRVLSLNEPFKRVHFLIPDIAKEEELKNQVLWINSTLLLLGVAGFLILAYITDGKFLATFFFFWWAFSEWVRYVLVKKGTLPKIDISKEATYFYDNFTSKVQAGINNIPGNYEIVRYLEVPGSNDIILLLRYESTFPLVLRCRLHGGIVWRFEVHTSPDETDLNIAWDNGNLQITNKSALSIRINATTGTIIDSG